MDLPAAPAPAGAVVLREAAGKTLAAVERLCATAAAAGWPDARAALAPVAALAAELGAKGGAQEAAEELWPASLPQAAAAAAEYASWTKAAAAREQSPALEPATRLAAALQVFAGAPLPDAPATEPRPPADRRLLVQEALRRDCRRWEKLLLLSSSSPASPASPSALLDGLAAAAAGATAEPAAKRPRVDGGGMRTRRGGLPAPKLASPRAGAAAAPPQPPAAAAAAAVAAKATASPEERDPALAAVLAADRNALATVSSTADSGSSGDRTPGTQPGRRDGEKRRRRGPAASRQCQVCPAGKRSTAISQNDAPPVCRACNATFWVHPNSGARVRWCCHCHRLHTDRFLDWVHDRNGLLQCKKHWVANKRRSPSGFAAVRLLVFKEDHWELRAPAPAPPRSASWAAAVTAAAPVAAV